METKNLNDEGNINFSGDESNLKKDNSKNFDIHLNMTFSQEAKDESNLNQFMNGIDDWIMSAKRKIADAQDNLKPKVEELGWINKDDSHNK